MVTNNGAKKVLVTGGCGFVGYHLARILSNCGHQVSVIDRIPPLANGLPALINVRYYQGYLQHLAELNELLEGVDTVFHLAWSYFPEAGNKCINTDIQSNLISTIHLLQSCVQSRVRQFIFLSTGGAVYGPVQMSPVSETHPTRPLSSYGVTKLAAEKYIELYHHLYGIEYAILRPSLPYGPGQNPFGRQGVIAVFMGKILQGQPITILGDGDTIMRDFFYVSDLVQACLQAADSPETSLLLNLGGGEPIKLSRLVENIQDVVEDHYPVRVQYAPPRPYDPCRLILDIRRAQMTLGWYPQVSLRDGLRRTWDWVQATYGCQQAELASERNKAALVETAAS